MIDKDDIARLRKEQEQFSLNALRSPGEKNEFEYGYRCGVLEGMRRAEAVLLARIEEQERADKL